MNAANLVVAVSINGIKGKVFYQKGRALIIMNKNRIKEWMEENLVPLYEAHKFTDQSIYGFRQSVKTDHVKPFYQHVEGQKRTLLFLKEDLEKYRKRKAENMASRNQRRGK